MKSVQLAEVSRVYGRTFVLHRACITLRAGQLTLLVGENGAGKTTLLNILATLDRPTSGTLQYDDIDATTFARHHRSRIGWVSHDTLLYEELTARENLTFYGRMYGLTRLEEKVELWLQQVRLVEDADRRVRNFSRGMKQRLSIARALLHAPDLLILDEPMTGLDEKSRTLTYELLANRRDKGAIIVMVTHDLEIPVGLVDRLVLMKAGKIVKDSAVPGDRSVSEILHSPNS